LQDAWKKIPHAGGDENKLFNQFRAACNHFFDAKKHTLKLLMLALKIT